MPTGNKSALILGISGQDGAILANQLVRKGWKVYGGYRRGSDNKFWRLHELGIFDQVELLNVNLLEPFQIMRIVSELRPDHIYQLSGDSFVVDSFNQPVTVVENVYSSTLNILEAMRAYTPESRLFFPSSSEAFGDAPKDQALDEQGPFEPLNPYGLSRLMGQKLVKIYRQHYGLFVCCGILFNHESSLRARRFVTRKVTYNLARLQSVGGDPVILGNLNASRDWGAARDYVRAMIDIMELDTPNDYVFASGRITKLRDLLGIASEYAGFEPIFEGEGLDEVCADKKSGRVLASVSPEFFRKSETPPLTGNPNRLKQAVGFVGSTSIEDTIVDMVKADIIRRREGRLDI